MGGITLYTRNILEDGSVTVSQTADSIRPWSRLYDRSLALYGQYTGTGTIDFTADQSADAKAVDFLAVKEHNFDGEDLQWQWSTDDFAADINDAVADWAQSGNAQIIKTLDTALTKDYWRLTVSSMTNPRCGEIFMSFGRDFEVLAVGAKKKKISNVNLIGSVGSVVRSVRLGDRKRYREYPALFDSTDITALRAALDELADAGNDLGPFWICDDESEYWFARFVEDPLESYQYGHRPMVLKFVEVLG